MNTEPIDTQAEALAGIARMMTDPPAPSPQAPSVIRSPFVMSDPAIPTVVVRERRCGAADQDAIRTRDAVTIGPPATATIEQGGFASVTTTLTPKQIEEALSATMKPTADSRGTTPQGE